MLLRPLLRASLLLATGAALLPAAVVSAAPQAAPHAAAAATTEARSTYTAVTGEALAGGTHHGTSAAGGTLVLASDDATRTVAGKSWETATWTSDWITPSHAFTEVVPSWRATTPAGTFVEIAVRARTVSGTATSYDMIGRWTTREAALERTSAGAQTDDYARVATDTFVATQGKQFRSWQLRVTLYRTHGSASPVVRTAGGVATLLPGTVPATSKPAFGAKTLDVPRWSQMIHKGEYPKYGGGGEAWCSPTSTAMLLGYYDALPSRSTYAWVDKAYADPWVDHVARATYDYGYRGTGNWAFNTAYAAQYVDDAFVTRLRNLREAERFIQAGIPLAASISFAKGGLDGAPISATDGHLVVISGFTSSGDVVVNDPAAPSNSSVRRTYDRGQFERAWLRKSGGTVYVVHDAAHPLPKRYSNTNW